MSGRQEPEELRLDSTTNPEDFKAALKKLKNPSEAKVLVYGDTPGKHTVMLCEEAQKLKVKIFTDTAQMAHRLTNYPGKNLKIENYVPPAERPDAPKQDKEP